jgi:hypothetical protein
MYSDILCTIGLNFHFISEDYSAKLSSAFLFFLVNTQFYFCISQIKLCLDDSYKNTYRFHFAVTFRFDCDYYYNLPVITF